MHQSTGQPEEEISSSECLTRCAERALGLFDRDGNLMLGFPAVLWLEDLVRRSRRVVDGTATTEDVEKIRTLLAALDRENSVWRRIDVSHLNFERPPAPKINSPKNGAAPDQLRSAPLTETP